MSKSGAAFILTLIGGITQIIAGLVVTLALGLTALAPTIVKGKTVSEPNSLLYLIPLIGVWVLATGIFAIVCAFKMRSEDADVVKKWGIITIVVAVVGLTGNIFTIIGGILGIIQSGEMKKLKDAPSPT